MAAAYAKATGRLGVCLATSGPGAIHLMNGLYDAKLDHVPVLAITGMQETSVLGTGYQQEVHTDKLYADLAEYNLVVDNPAQLPGVVDIAIRTALARRGVAHLSFPTTCRWRTRTRTRTSMWRRPGRRLPRRFTWRRRGAPGWRTWRRRRGS
jgi:thiamine pyrophosphate-dependent acetolactate synthase large subunit-like protein